MIDLATLADLVQHHGAELSTPVEPIEVGGIRLGGQRPSVMGVINLSRDSTYRESVAIDLAEADAMARVLAAQGAEIIDVGAESSSGRAARVGPAQQIDLLVPAVSKVAEHAVVSVETYYPQVVAAGLKAGAQVVNMTGREFEQDMVGMASDAGAAVILCFGSDSNVRDPVDVPEPSAAIDVLLRHFEPRIQRALDAGVSRLLIDPGIGFQFANVASWQQRVGYQTAMLLNSFRLRSLGFPIINSIPHSFDLFGEQFRKAEGFFAVWAALGRTDVYRVHEVAHVSRVLRALELIELAAPAGEAE